MVKCCREPASVGSDLLCSGPDSVESLKSDCSSGMVERSSSSAATSASVSVAAESTSAEPAAAASSSSLTCLLGELSAVSGDSCGALSWAPSADSAAPVWPSFAVSCI